MTKNRKIMISLITSILAVSIIIIWFVLIKSNHSQNVSHPSEDASSLDESIIKDKEIPLEQEAIDKDTMEDTNEKEDETITDSDIRAVSDDIIEGLNNRDMQVIDASVHQEKGLTFSPYVYITEDALTFNKEEITSIMESDEKFVWGDYDGKGTPIELTPRDYFDEFLNMEPFLHADDVLIDDIQDRGNTLNNIIDVFPDATVVEYYHEGSEEYAGMDWSSLILVYEKNEVDDLQLIAIVRDMWTI